MMCYGKFIYFTRSETLLCKRNCLLNFYQNISKGVLKYIKETIIPSKPKKPISPFLLYVKDISLKIKQEKPDTKYSEILKKASRGWAELNPVEKENFTKEYIKNYEIYTKQLKEYNNSITDEQKQLWEEKKKEYENSNKKINSKQKKLGKPKKPPNTYLLYLLSKKNEKDPNISFKDWLKSMTISWKKLPNIEKEPYVIKTMQLISQYKEDLEKWEMKMINSGHSDVVRLQTLLKYNLHKNEHRNK
ncbi:transcription factor A, mitochondrial [Apis mellifera caucasica]|uniref:Transcription factor A, mitochondrial n=1 Tax=Apis mellifera TaxID=7460 RepID=A0A7M7L1Z9_APIME|nr:transcription factor A, mitochondrial [Apis mellifera]KAG6801873.1 transcription factor A, mitochondrial [Apis mellifera caucasica]KAG9433450.1 transcription factor A, mitochondrial [Apis mellifera carnica]|eukprot:XP_026295501.1 transcription factor A, mitochondrial [Apis mellifera]